ncbi:Cys-tRNA(Pro) deacylase [Shewanella salipaludis]|uniref:Cys-tRNA(Pro)/Cys-tRNA(Cys) deacylase n=1 Tax=Shewanella salipaludis TaxID=2723052 RepID=A0A972FVR6_9GAMM|nr:Cys-tRNA(Pro) deacylase [Shewanella salipaludis]NMH66507.1 Cys-tRNA(Pro) deacylase [Shewanella salipaludis]
MTPAVRLVKGASIDFSLHDYPHQKHCEAYGEEAAAALGLDPAQVFKTLLLAMDKGLAPVAVALVPVSHQLDLKAAAEQLKCKRLVMATPEAAQRSSGYLVGGISPLAQKKRLPTLIDSSALDLARLYVSGGRRGLEICLAPQDLAALCQGSFARIQHSE